jgi:hypothetical protein
MKQQPTNPVTPRAEPKARYWPGKGKKGGGKCKSKQTKGRQVTLKKYGPNVFDHAASAVLR